jgi:hypothetical protein
MPFFYSQYLKDEKQKPKTKLPPPSPRNSTARRSSGGSNLSTGRLVWHSNVGGGRLPSKKNNFQPLKYRDGKKTVHFSTIEVQHFHFDWNSAADCFYSRKELTAMGSARFDDAALLRKERQLDVPSSNQPSSDDLDVGIKNKPKCINALLQTALEDKDENPLTSIRGIEHFVYPDLQQEMIRKKKEVQAQVIQFVRSKRPDPQGWRLANHSRMYSQWARDVALEKGRAYRMDKDRENVSPSNFSSPQSHSLSRCLTSSASFSAASYCEPLGLNSPSNNSLSSTLGSPSSLASPGGTSPRRSSDVVRSTGLLNNSSVEASSLVGSTVLQFQELRIQGRDSDDDIRKAMSDEHSTRQSAGANTDEA